MEDFSGLDQRRYNIIVGVMTHAETQLKRGPWTAGYQFTNDFIQADMHQSQGRNQARDINIDREYTQQKQGTQCVQTLGVFKSIN